jgi:hypothetical protein
MYHLQPLTVTHESSEAERCLEGLDDNKCLRKSRPRSSFFSLGSSYFDAASASAPRSRASRIRSVRSKHRHTPYVCLQGATLSLLRSNVRFISRRASYLAHSIPIFCSCCCRIEHIPSCGPRACETQVLSGWICSYLDKSTFTCACDKLPGLIQSPRPNRTCPRLLWLMGPISDEQYT